MRRYGQNSTRERQALATPRPQRAGESGSSAKVGAPCDTKKLAGRFLLDPWDIGYRPFARKGRATLLLQPRYLPLMRRSGAVRWSAAAQHPPSSGALHGFYVASNGKPT
jgi:hypothetical protein